VTRLIAREPVNHDHRGAAARTTIHLLADLDVTLRLSGIGSVGALSRDALVDRREL
jgi:hypothetical protein